MHGFIQRPARRRAHRRGHAVRFRPSLGAGGSDGPGTQHVPLCRRAAHRADRSAAPTWSWWWPTGTASCRLLNNLFANAAKHAPRVVAYPRRRAARRRACRRLGLCRGAGRGARLAGTGLGFGPSARGSWKRMAAASEPRAAGPGRARGSPSHCRWRKRRAQGPPRSRAAPIRSATGWKSGASPSTTTIRRRCATCATRWPLRAYAPIVTGDHRELAQVVRKEAATGVAWT